MDNQQHTEIIRAWELAQATYQSQIVVSRFETLTITPLAEYQYFPGDVINYYAGPRSAHPDALATQESAAA